MFLDILILGFLLCFIAFFSAAETAFFSISRTKARHLAKENEKPYLLIHHLKENPHRLLTTLLIGQNVVTIGASALATTVALKAFSDYALGLATGIMTLLILVFGEVFPKSLATRNNVAIARLTVYPVYWCSVLFFPISKFLNFIPLLTGKLQKTSIVTEEELMTIVEVVEEEGEIKEEERELIHNIFEFDDTNASEIMTPRADMFVVDAGQPLDLQAVASSGFTRIPVIDADIDHVVGIVNIKDIFVHQSVPCQAVEIRNIMRPPYFVPENKKLDSLLRQFKKRKNHIAIVVDEHGGVSGLITLEDVLEELVGEISDETDLEEPRIIKVQNNEWIVPGKSDIDTVNELIPMNIPDSKEFDTFSGYVLDQTGRIPRVNEEIPIGDFLVIVQEMDGNRVKQYRIKLLSPPESPN
ncbi:MAG: HlyC/CorC family transporter [Deltaproteobacteria bacterium]|nr:HlyC/CorC family transporter [Deltaproteobacteria bacterium]